MYTILVAANHTIIIITNKISEYKARVQTVWKLIYSILHAYDPNIYINSAACFF